MGLSGQGFFFAWIALASAGGGEEHGGLFDPHGGLPLWTLAVCILLVGLLVRFVVPLLGGMLKERETSIATVVQSAHARKLEARSGLERAQDLLAGVDGEARAILDEGGRDVEALVADKEAGLALEVQKIQARSEREVDLARGAALAEVRRFTIDRVMDLASERITTRLGPAEHRALIRNGVRRTVEELGALSEG